jgi:hypothetical protein
MKGRWGDVIRRGGGVTQSDCPPPYGSLTKHEMKGAREDEGTKSVGRWGEGEEWRSPQHLHGVPMVHEMKGGREGV